MTITEDTGNMIEVTVPARFYPVAVLLSGGAFGVLLGIHVSAWVGAIFALGSVVVALRLT